MYAPYPENMMESIKKVEATRAQRMATEPRRLTAEEKDALLEKFHPDYNPDAFAEIKVGPNKGQKAPLELAEMLHSTSRLINEKVDRERKVCHKVGQGLTASANHGVPRVCGGREKQKIKTIKHTDRQR